MPDIEIPVDPGDFEVIRLGKIRPTIDEFVLTNSRPWGSYGPMAALYVERIKGVRTGRWMASRVIMDPRYKHINPPVFIPEWPPIAMNNNPNPAAARIPIGGQS